MSNLRIPRKLKKKYKKIWKERTGCDDVRIIRYSIFKSSYMDSVIPVWGCTVEFTKR